MTIWQTRQSQNSKSEGERDNGLGGKRVQTREAAGADRLTDDGESLHAVERSVPEGHVREDVRGAELVGSSGASDHNDDRTEALAEEDGGTDWVERGKETAGQSQCRRDNIVREGREGG